MDILILYPEIMPYNLPVWRILRDSGYTIRVIQAGSRKLTPFHYDGEEGIEVHDISEWNDYNSFKSENYVQEVKLVFMSEVMIKWYWRLAYYYHKKSISTPILLGSDAQWTGSINNYIKKIFFGFTYKRVFTHVLSAGLWQIIYALKIGFKRDQILKPLYCSNNELYYKIDIEKKKEKYPKQFIYVGRFNSVKGLRELMSAWKRISDKKGWSLVLIGNGPMEEELKRNDNVEILPFMSQNEICTIMQNSGCALVPSIKEPWGLVVHESVAAGLPIIVSKNCGATNEFVIDKYNGLVIEIVSADNLYHSMVEIINMDEEKLIKMSYRSRKMARRILPEHVACQISSLIR